MATTSSADLAGTERDPLVPLRSPDAGCAILIPAKKVEAVTS
jgi:hypothetical protein